MEERKHLIYVFVDDKQKPFYVGRTYKLVKRKKEHLAEVRYGNTLPKYNKLRKLINAGHDFNNLVLVLENNIPSDLIEEKEIYYIAKLREEGYDLKNLTEEGEGWKHITPELSKKLSKSRTGTKLSQVNKDKIRASKKGKKFSEEHKNNLSIARKKRVTKIETRIKTSNTSKGKINIKKYILIDPDGKEYITEQGLTMFCEQHGLCAPNFSKVLKGERNNVCGWKIQRID